MLRLLTCLLLIGLSLDVNTSLADGSPQSVEELTRQLLALNAQSQQGDTAAHQALVRVAKARQERLATLIADHPELVLRHALSARSRAAFPAAARAYLEEERSAEGELLVLHEDGPTGGRYRHFVKQAAERLALHFAAGAPALQTGDRVRVSGLRVGQAMALSSGSSQVSVLSLASSNTFGAQPTAVILVNFQDKPTETWLTTAQAQDVVFGTGSASVTNFYLEGSYGQTSLAGDVYGIYTIPVNSTSCDPASIANYAWAAAAAQVGEAKMATYTRFVFAFPKNACAWWGFATVGGYPSEAWINGSFENTVVAHEVGHNYGLYHSHALECGSASIGSGCSSIDYGDVLDVMGLTSTPMHFNAVQKELLGWLNDGVSPPITAVQASGVYTLDPYESSGSNPKALKVKTPSGDWYYVEYRQAIGFDAAAVSANANVKNGVVVHLWSSQDPDKIYLLDMTPATSSWSDPALDLNNSFSDPAAGIAIAPVWVGGTAGVNVTVASSSCARKNPTVAVSPPGQSGMPGLAVSYTVTVTNNDTGCAASAFSAQAAAPAGWTASFSASTLDLAPGATASTTLQVTSPVSASAGAYGISLVTSNALAPSYSGSATATYTVTTGFGGTFTDNFDRGDSAVLGNGWTQVAGTLMIQAGQARNAAVKIMHTAVQAGLAGATQNASVSFASVTNNGGPRFGVLLRYKDAKNYYLCSRLTGGTSLLRISKVVNGVETVLKYAHISNPSKNVFFTIGCQVDGTTLTLTFNGAAKLSTTDSTLASGSVGMTMGYPSSGGAGASHRADNFSAVVR